MDTRLRSLVVPGSLLLFVACGGGGSSADTTPEQPEEASICKVDEAVKATAKPKPKESGCIDKAKYAALATACADNKDPVACYQIGVCVKLQSMGVDLSPEDKAKHEKAILDSMRVACDAGIANACVFRAGIISETLKENPAHPQKAELEKQKCADVVRACQLGDESGGCYSCRVFECK